MSLDMHFMIVMSTERFWAHVTLIGSNVQMNFFMMCSCCFHSETFFTKIALVIFFITML